MTDERIAAIEARHAHIGSSEPCQGQMWGPDGCDTQTVLARLRKVEQERDREAANHDVTFAGAHRMAEERDAARAECERLNEHLRRVIHAHESGS